MWVAAKGDKGVTMAYDSLIADPMIKSHGEVAKAADVLDAYVHSQLQKNETGLAIETMEAGHDRLAAAGDDRYGELYEAVTAYRG